MLCPKCKTGHAHRSHRSGPLEWLAGLVAIRPYRCGSCGHRFFQFRYGEAMVAPRNEAEREIRATRGMIEWRRKRREVLLYGAGMLLFLLFLYFITRERGGPPDGS